MSYIYIGGMLIHNRFRPSSSSTQSQDNKYPLQPTAIAEKPLSKEIIPGCFACGKCYVCKMGYLTPCDSFTSYHTTQVFSIGLIYLAECITCVCSFVGYSISNLPKRFSNHMSHIKRNVKSCRLAKCQSFS